MKFKIKQHLIYFSMMLIMSILLNEGFFVILVAFFVVIKRFPRTYYIYLLFGILSFWWLKLALINPDYQLPTNSEKYIANVIEIKKQNKQKQIAIIKIEGIRCYLTTNNIEPKLMPGDIIEVEGILKEPRKSTIPHQFDFQKYLKTHEIPLTIYGTNLVKRDNRWSIRRYQYNIANFISTNYPNLTATYMNSFLFGVRDDLTEDIEEAYKNLGVFHLFAISGLHVNLLVSLWRLAFKRMGLIHELINVIIIIFLLIFIVIAGGTPSIVRAGLMSILAIINRQFKVNLSSLDIFSIVLIGNFVVNPLQVFQIGFIFSYWITFILISSQSFINQLSIFKKALFIPFLVQIAALPIQLFISYEFNLLAYVSNLIIIPLVTTFLIPMLIFSLFIPDLSLLVEKILFGFESFNLWGAKLLNAFYISGALSFTTVILLISIFIMMCWYYELTSNKWGWFALVMSFFITLEGQRILQLESKLTFLDVGQGDGIVIQSSFQRCTTIVDTGGDFSFSGESKSIFPQTLEIYLLGEGVREVDYLILTHGDYDHIAEALPLLERFKVKSLVIGEGEPKGLLKEVISLANEKGVEVIRKKAGEELTCSNQKLTFLHPEDESTFENKDSLVKILEIEGFTALLTGDISTNEENEVLEKYNLDSLDVYKVAHHGSKYSNSKFFLESLGPKYAVVSAGRNNIYGHPSQEIVKLFEDLNIPLLSTQDYGSIQFKITKKRGKVFSMILNK